MTIREMPFRNFRGRSLTKLEARDECKKQKTPKNKDKAWNSITSVCDGVHLSPITATCPDAVRPM